MINIKYFTINDHWERSAPSGDKKTMPQNPIELVDLRKEYGSFTAVDGLNLSIRKNSFTGLLGPNGAGKSTTLKILTHLIRPTSGVAFLNGHDVTKDPKEALTGVGTVIETPEFYGYLTPRETFRYVGGIIGMTHEAVVSQTDEILEKVKMTEWADKKLSTFSKGMRQRIALGQALLDDPSVIILDEPTSGLDPRGMAEIREVLKNLRNNTNDLTIVMSSHILHEVEDLCDRVAMVNHGRLIMEGDIGVVSSVSGVENMVLRTEGVPDEAMIEKVRGLPAVVSAERSGNEILIKYDTQSGSRSALFSGVSGLGIGAYSLAEGDNLEAKYMDLIKESR